MSKTRVSYLLRRPKRCPHCGGEVYDIIWGMPTADAQERHFEDTGHHAVLGGCCILEEGNPDYECSECRMQFRRISFPANAKRLAKEALLKDDQELFCDVEYIGLYKKQKVYWPVANSGICWDGICAITVDEFGKVSKHSGVKWMDIICKIERRRRK